DAPKDARSLGCIESRQRHISFRMKRRGMHWSAKGAESMVKVKQGILNGTLREVYLMSQKRSKRKQREIKQTEQMSQYIRKRKKHISLQTKRRSMNWSAKGAETMVKVKQGILNGTLREVYLMSQKRSKRKQREIKQTVHMSQYFRKTKHANNSRQGSISLYAAHSSAVGRLLK